MRESLLLCCAVLLIGPGMAQESAPTMSPDQQAVRKNAEAFVNSFNRGDAASVASLWAENGEMSLDGDALAVGRDQIEQQYGEYFLNNPGATIEVQIDSIRVLGPSLAVERGHSEVINDQEDSVVDAYRLVYTKQDGQWLIVSADVQQERIETPFDWKAELSSLVGTWGARDGDWSVSTKIEWVPGGNFLKRSFSVNEGDMEDRTGIQIIGWDALEQSVVSWTFGTDGGHGRGRWTQDGNQWHIETNGVSPYGEVITATNVITILNGEAFRWQSTKRTVDGVAFEDTQPVTVKRSNTEQ